MKITCRVYVDEYNNAHYFRDFTVADTLPEIGDSLNGFRVTDVLPVQPDCENSNTVWGYTFFEIRLADEEGEPYNSEWLCVEKQDYGTWLNDCTIDLVTIDGDVYALYGWNGEDYGHCWKCLGDDLDESSEEEYTIRPLQSMDIYGHVTTYGYELI